MSTSQVAVLYLARGVDVDCFDKFENFIRSYHLWNPGRDHDIFVVFKGFPDAFALSKARAMFSGLGGKFIDVDDGSYDIGAYVDALREISQEQICFLNTNSEIQCSSWLQKLSLNLDRGGVGIVSASGSFESLSMLGRNFPEFPNIHVRSNAFMLKRKHFLDVAGRNLVSSKKDAWLLESGSFGFTRYMFSIGLEALIVGKNGRGYTPSWWASSEIFKVRDQSNLMVHDNVTRGFQAMTWEDKARACKSAWGLSLTNPGCVI